MSELGTELSQQLREALRLQGGPPDLRLSTEVIPVINAFTLDDTPWHGRHSFAFTGGVVGAVGNHAYLEFGLRSDAPATARLVVRRIVCIPNGGATFFQLSHSHAGVTNAPGPGGGAVAAYEADQGGSSTSQIAPINAIIGTTAGGDFQRMAMVHAANLANMEFLGPLTFGRNTIVQVRAGTSNLEAYFSVQGDIYGL